MGDEELKSEAANDNSIESCAHARDAARDIAALATSGHVEAGGALPISQRVQTSGRGDPQLPRWSAEAERAQRILGRGYAEGGEARRCALALWLMNAYPGGVAVLAIALGVVLESERERHLVVREWTRWGVGGSADAIVTEAAALLGRAVGWYETASEAPGCAGHLAALISHADGVRDEDGVVGRLREWHKAWVAERVDCHSIARKLRCDGVREPRPELRSQPTCNTRPFSWSELERTRRPRCGDHDEDCGMEWPSVCGERSTGSARARDIAA